MKNNIIDYIVKHNGLKQKDIAKKLGVTPGQVTKWKNGEHISKNRQEELNKLAGLDEKIDENDAAWFEFFMYKDEYQEWPVFEIEDPEIMVPMILDKMHDLGIRIPKKAPSIKDYEDLIDPEVGDIIKDDYDDSIDHNLDLHDFIENLFDCWGSTIHWWKKYIEGYDNDDLMDLRWQLMDHTLNIAFLSILDSSFKGVGGNLDKLTLYRKETKRIGINLIERYCEELMANGLPINEDYFKLITLKSGDLSNEIETIVFQKGYARPRKIRQYLPYADQILLENQEYGIDLLESLNRKIDTLLSKKDKQKFINDPNTLMEEVP